MKACKLIVLGITNLLPITARNPRVDACRSIAGARVISYEQALGCYDMFPLSDSTKMKTLDTLNKTLEFYSLLDPSQGPYDSRLLGTKDIQLKLNQFREREFKNAREFQTELMVFFNELYDGHTVYSNGCFQQFIFELPISLYSSMERKRKVIRLLDNEVHGIFPNIHLPQRENTYKQYANYEVISINDQNPINFLKEYARRHVGTSRDVNAQLALTLARAERRGSSWFAVTGDFSSTSIIPQTKTITIKLRNRKENADVITINVDYNVRSPARFTDKESYFSTHCVSNTIGIETEVDTESFSRVKRNSRKPNYPINDMINSVDNLEIIYDKMDVAAYMMGEVGAIVIPTFSNQGAVWRNDLKEALVALQSRSKKLIIDLSNNRGGLACFGYQILEYLFDKEEMFPSVLRYSPLAEKLTKCSKLNDFHNPKLQRFNQSILPRPICRDPQCHGFIPDLKTNCRRLGLLDRTPRLSLQESDIAIVTNSICFSTCALFTSYISKHTDARTYTSNTITRRAPTLSSMAGGAVYNFDKLHEALSQCSLTNHPDAPRPFPTKSWLSFTLSATFSRDSPPKPLELNFLPAQKNLVIRTPQDNAIKLNPHLAWFNIAEDLKR